MSNEAHISQHRMIILHTRSNDEPIRSTPRTLVREAFETVSDVELIVPEIVED